MDLSSPSVVTFSLPLTDTGSVQAENGGPSSRALIEYLY